MSANPTQALKRQNNYFDGIKVRGFHKWIFFLIMLAFFFEQMDNWNWSFIAPAVLKSWGLEGAASNKAMGNVAFMYFMGMTLGGFLGGVISDRIGRRKTFLFSIVLFSGCSVINGLPIDNMVLFITARTLTGFGVFSLMVCSQGYIAEMSPAETRGKWQGLIGAVGYCAVPVIALLCRQIVPLAPDAWRFIFYFGGLGFIAFVFSWKYLKESPRWLVAQGRVEEAEKVIFEITGEQIELSEATRVKQPKSGIVKSIVQMVSPKYLKRTLILSVSYALLIPAGFTFSVWMTKLLVSVPQIDPATGLALLDASGRQLMLYGQKTVLTIMTLITCGIPCGYVLASFIADKGGRKIPLCAVMLLTACLYYVFGQSVHNLYLLTICGFVHSTVNTASASILMVYKVDGMASPDKIGHA